MKKRNLLVLLASFSLLLAGCNSKKDDGGKKDPEPVEPSGDVRVISVTVTPSTLALNVGDTGNLEASVLPTNATNPTVTWSSADSGIASVANGVVTAVAPGTTKITATADGKSGECTVTVSNTQPAINHQDPFVSTVTDPSLTRSYREEFDEMIEDFSSETPTGTTTGTFNKPLLRVLVDSQDINEPQSPDAAIYKMATGVYAIQNFEGIGFRMRAVGNKAINLSNLVLGLRGDDAYKVYPLNLGEALDPDQEELPELTDQFQDIIISPQQSLDAATVYELAAGGPSEQTVLGKILGFHLYALDEECSAVIEIENVFLYEAGEKTILDSFNRAAVKKTDDTCFWRDSTGFIVQRGVTLKNASYTTKAIELGDYENIVINILGDTSGLKINNIAYSAFKDAEDHPLTGAVNGAFMPYVINLSHTNMALVEGKLVFESTTEIVISQIYLSNLQDEAPVLEYPQVDIADAVYFDKFNNRTMAPGTLDGDYDKSAADQATQDAGFNFILSYAGSDKISIADGKLVLDAQEAYSQYKAGSKVSFAGKKYMLISAKGDMSGLRIALKNSGTILYANQWLAGAGLPTLPADPANYPYNQADGYRLYVVDLAKSGYEADVSDIVDLYYTGTGLLIDAILFADEVGRYTLGDEIILYGNTPNANLANYGQLCTFDVPSDVNAMRVRFTSTSGATLISLRFSSAGGECWFKDNKVIDVNGDPIPGTTVIPAAGLELDIDLAASGLSGAAALHSGGFGDATGDAAVASMRKLVESAKYTVGDPITLYNNVPNANLANYGQLCTLDIPTDAVGMRLHFTSTAGATLISLRFSSAGGECWFKDSKVIDMEGNPIPATLEVPENGSLDLDINIAASELSGAAAIHSGGFGDATGDIELESAVRLLEVPKYIQGDAVTLYNNVANGNLANYAQLNTFDVPTDARGMRITLSSEAGATLISLRFSSAGGECWFKDNKVIDMEGNVISADTAIPANGTLVLDIDLVASGLSGAAAFHSGGFGDATGDVLVASAYRLNVNSPYAKLLEAYAG